MSRPAKQFEPKTTPRQLKALTKEQRKQYLGDLFKAAYAQLKDQSWKKEIGGEEQFRQIVSLCMKDGTTLNLILKGVPQEFSKGIQAAREYLQAAPGSEKKFQQKVEALASLGKKDEEAAKAAEKADREKVRAERKAQQQIESDRGKIDSRIAGLGELLRKQGGVIYAALAGDEVRLIVGGTLYQITGSGSSMTRVSGQPEPCYLLENQSGTFRAVAGQVSYADAIGATSTGVTGLAYRESKNPRQGPHISINTSKGGGPYPLLQMPGKGEVQFYGTAVEVTAAGNLQLRGGRPLRRGQYPNDADLTVDITKIPETVTIVPSGLQVDGNTLIHLDDEGQFTLGSRHIAGDPDWYASALAHRLAAHLVDGTTWAATNKPYFYLKFEPGIQMRLHVSIRASFSQVVTRLSQAIEAGEQWSDALNVLFDNPGLHVTAEASYGAQNLGIYPAGATVGGLDGTIGRYVIRDQPTWNTYLRLTVNSTADAVDQLAAGSPAWLTLQTRADTLIAQARQMISAAALTGMLAP